MQTRWMQTASTIPSQLLALALPLVPRTGFSSATLSTASLSLPAPHTPPAPGLSQSTINALFPSAPPSTSRHPSLSRLELRQDAQDSLHRTTPDLRDHERVGPAKALVEAWLEEGRRVMVQHVKAGPWTGEAAVREALRKRLAYNEPVLHLLPEALALLAASTKSPLSSFTAALPIPSPAPILEYIARIAHDAALVSGDERSGVAWYRSRARIGTIYSLTEAHLLSPLSAPLPPAERIDASLDLLDRLLNGSQAIESQIKGTSQFGEWIVKSWMGMGRSLGV